jgi:glyoxylase-like metal-dependent hydrolase (beta-lactamase superfamily II)
VQEIAPGIFHWITFHQGINMQVCSYYVEPAGVVIDPMVPDDGFEVFDGHTPPQQALLTIRHHYRGCDEFKERFDGLTVACHEAGLHEFEGTDRVVEGFSGGDEVAPGITAVATDAISPDDVTLHITHGGSALAFGDGLVRPPGGPLMFVPDNLIGDDPETVKAGLYDAYRGLLERDFDTLLFAHGEPLVGGGHAALKEFVSGS